MEAYLCVLNKRHQSLNLQLKLNVAPAINAQLQSLQTMHVSLAFFCFLLLGGNPVDADIVEQARPQYGNRFNVGSYVTFDCIYEFTMLGDKTIWCNPGGHWNPQPPICTRQGGNRAAIARTNGYNNSRLTYEP